MAKPVGDLVQDYVDMKLGCGGCVMSVGAVIAAYIGISMFIGKLKEKWVEYVVQWLPIILFIVVIWLAHIVYSNTTKKNRASKNAGILIMIGAIPQIGMAIMSFRFSVDMEWMNIFGWLDIVFAIALLLFGGKVYRGPETE